MPTVQRPFALADVLTIATGRLVSPRHMEAVYDTLNFLTGARLFTHQLPAAMRLCQPLLAAQHPFLASPTLREAVEALSAELNTPAGKDNPVAILTPWLAQQAALYGETVVLTPIPGLAERFANPIADAVEMIGTDRVIVLDTNNGKD